MNPPFPTKRTSSVATTPDTSNAPSAVRVPRQHGLHCVVLIAALIAAVAATGCGGLQRAYPGPVLAPADVAIVQGALTDAWIEGGSSLVALRSIDGQRHLGAWQGDPQAQVELLPGNHVIGVEHHGGSAFAAARGSGIAESLELRLRAGQRYVVYYSRTHGAFFVGESEREDMRPTGSVPGDAVRCVPSSATQSRCPLPGVSER